MNSDVFQEQSTLYVKQRLLFLGHQISGKVDPGLQRPRGNKPGSADVLPSPISTAEINRLRTHTHSSACSKYRPANWIQGSKGRETQNN